MTVRPGEAMEGIARAGISCHNCIIVGRAMRLGAVAPTSKENRAVAGPGSLRKRPQPQWTELRYRALRDAAEAALAGGANRILERALKELVAAWDRAPVEHGRKWSEERAHLS